MKSMKYLLIAPDGKRIIAQRADRKLSTHLGAIDLRKLKPGKIKSSTGQTFIALPATFADLLQHSARGPAVVLPKDAAAIISHSGLSWGNTVVDIGTGSGWLAAQLAHAVGPSGKVSTYETRKEFAQLAERNFKFLGLKNVDLVTVDLPEPHLILKNAELALKPGKFLAACCPQITQVLELVRALDQYSFRLESVLEVHEREWLIRGKLCRPQHNALTHTTFLVLCRKI